MLVTLSHKTDRGEVSPDVMEQERAIYANLAKARTRLSTELATGSDPVLDTIRAQLMEQIERLMR